MLDTRLVVAGALIGLVVGFTGMGGGALTTPLLILVAGVRPVMAVGTDLVFAAITKAVGAATHLRQRTVDLRVAGLLAAGAIPAALAGVALVSRLGEGADGFIRRALGVVLVCVAVSVLARQRFARVPPIPSRERAPLTVALGAGVGFVVGVTSVGSGTLMMAVLLLVYRILPAGKLVGTDVVQGFLLTAAAGAAHWHAGHVDWTLLRSMLVGSVPGVWLGSRLSSRAPDGVLRPLLAVVLAVSGLRLI